MIEANAIRARVAEAKRLAGSTPWLIGYDANGIQEFVTASSRPIAMRGSSETIKDFDKTTREGKNGPKAIFAGGGRGVILATSPTEAEKHAGQLVREFQRITHGGVLAVAVVPFDTERQKESLAWLRHKLEIAKDAAIVPRGDLPANKEEQCAECRTNRGVHRKDQYEDDNGDTGELVCARCADMKKRGQSTKQMSRSLVDLSPATGTVAAVSADGNNLGAFFASLSSLEELAAASSAIATIFQEAHQEALNQAHPAIPLVTGGDDIRAFLAPEHLLSYIEALVRGVERRAGEAGSLGGLLTRPVQIQALAALGVGVGAVVADSHFPASRLMSHAHDLEDSAKSACCSGSDRSSSPRSAFDFAMLLSGDAFSQGLEGRQRHGEDLRPINMAAQSWENALRRAEALGRVPKAQRAVLAQERTMSPEEFANLLRYRVARSDEWQAWYKMCGHDWHDPEIVFRERPRAGTLDLLRLMKGREERT